MNTTTKQHTYPPKFYRLIGKLIQASTALSDYCSENEEQLLADFFWRLNGIDGLRFYWESLIEAVEPSFGGKTEAAESKRQLIIERAQRRRKRQAAKLKIKK